MGLQVKFSITIDVQVKLRVLDPVQGPIPMRLMASSAMGGWLTREVYREYLDPVTGHCVS